MTLGSAAPAGYVRVSVGRCAVTTLAAHEDDARVLLREGTLYDAARRDQAARPLQGRGVAYAIALPVTGVKAVVRHNRHGGMLASITRDLFLPPTRAPHELATSLRLTAMGIATPDVLMYGIVAAGGLFRRSDVVTREVLGGRDLATVFDAATGESNRSAAWTAAADLVGNLARAGVRHHDLNVKNILLSGDGAGLRAWLLDVDRVSFHPQGDVAVHRANVERLLRSARKWRDERAAVVDLDAVTRLLA